jgi:ABC-type sugar transport system permease subunit
MYENIVLQIASCPPGMTCLPSFTALNFSALAISIGVALVYGVAGYLNSINQNGETFNRTMFIKTLVTSIVVGYVIVWLGLSPTTGYTQAFAFVTGNTVIMGLIDQFVNALFNMAGEIKADTQTPVGPAQ